MPGKILAVGLLILGGGVTLYVLYKVALAVLQPVVQKKIAQQMEQDRFEQLENNLQLHQQDDQNQVKMIRQRMKK